MAKAASFRDLTASMARDHGFAATLRRVETVGDPITGTVTEVETDYPIRLLPPKDFQVEQIDGTIFQANDLAAELPAKDAPVTPKADDRVIIDGDPWRIVSVAPVFAFGGEVVLYRLQLRV